MMTPTLTLPAITQEFALNTIRANRAFGQIENRIVQFGTRISNLGIAMSLAISLPLQVAIGAMVKHVTELDQVITQAFAKIEGAGAGVKVALSEAATALSMQTSTTAVDLAKGMKELIASGYSAAESIKAVAIVEKFATAGELDMNAASSTLVSTMAALGLRTGDVTQDMANMTRVSDVLTKAADMTRVGVTQFADALTHKGLIALRLSNKELEEGVAILATFAQQGIEGSRAGEYLYRSIRDIETTAQKHSETWDQLVGKVYDGSGALKNVATIIGMLEAKLAGANDQQARQFLMMLKLPDRSLAATLALLGFSKEISHFEEVLRGAAGTTERVWRIQMSSFANQLAITKNQVLAMGKDIGTVLVPMMIWLGQQVQRLVAWWFTLTDAQKRSYIAWGLIIAVTGPVVLTIGILISMFGQLVGAAWAVATAIYGVASAFIAWGAAQLFAMGPIGIIIGLVIILVVVLVGQQGLTWAFQQLGKVVGFVFQEIETQVKNTMSGAQQELAKTMEMANMMFGGKGFGAAGGMALAGAGIGGASIAGVGAASFGMLESSISSGIATGLETSGLDMTGFNKSEFKNYMDDMTGDFDESLLETEDKKKKSQGAASTRGFSAQLAGTEEEHRARVTGQQELLKSTDKMLLEQKQTNKNTAAIASSIDGLRKDLAKKKGVDLKDANFT